MEPMTMIAIGGLAISGLTSLIGLKQQSDSNKQFNENSKAILSQSSNDMNLWKGIAMGQSGLGGGAGMPQMAAPGAYPWA